MSTRWGRWFAILVVMMAAVSLRVFFSGLREYRAGKASLEAGDLDEAIVRFRRAATWYLPVNPVVRRSLDALEAIAKASEAKASASGADARLARRAWEAERSALLGSRHVFVPHADRLAVANQHIAPLIAAEEGERRGSGEKGETLAYHRRLLERIPGPKVGWTLLAMGGFGLWLGGAALFIFRGLSMNDALRVRPAFLSGVLVVVGFSVFMLGLSMA